MNYEVQYKSTVLSGGSWEPVSIEAAMYDRCESIAGVLYCFYRVPPGTKFFRPPGKARNTGTNMRVREVGQGFGLDEGWQYFTEANVRSDTAVMQCKRCNEYIYGALLKTSTSGKCLSCRQAIERIEEQMKEDEEKKDNFIIYRRRGTTAASYWDASHTFSTKAGETTSSDTLRAAALRAIKEAESEGETFSNGRYFIAGERLGIEVVLKRTEISLKWPGTSTIKKRL